MVKLSEVAEVLDSSDSTVRFYYDRREDRVVCIIDAYLPAQKAIINRVESDNGSKYVTIRPQEDIVAAAMEAFAEAQPEGELRSILSSAVESGGTRRFRDAVESAGILDSWKSFRIGFVLGRAREWCSANGVAFSE